MGQIKKAKKREATESLPNDNHNVVFQTIYLLSEMHVHVYNACISTVKRDSFF
jgi:hypothetical protein